MRRLFFRIICKLVEYMCHIRTYIVPPYGSDPARILVSNLTPSQLLPRKLAAPKNSECSIAIIVPFRDQWKLTSLCIDSLFEQAMPEKASIHLYLVDNGSIEEETLNGIEQAKKRYSGRIDLIHDNRPFNFSSLNNRAAKLARDRGCNWLLFLNNDIEFTQPHSLKSLVDFGQETDSPGAIGCTLTFSDGKIQHLFVAPGVKILAAHPLKGCRLPKDSLWFDKPRIVPAVTGAVLLMGTSAFFEVGCFDEALPTLGQDVDLCLKLQKAGYLNWTLPHVSLVHHESVSRGQQIDPNQVGLLYERWGDFLLNNPFYSPRFSRWSETPAMKIGEPAFPWRFVLP